MIKLLLVSPKTEQSKGGIAVWTDAFLAHCVHYGIDCDLLNIATIGSRAKQGNAKRDFKDEFVRTKAIFQNLRAMLKENTYDVAHINTSCGIFGLIRDYLTVKKIKKKQASCKRILHFHCDIQTQCKSLISRYFLSKILNVSDDILVLNKRNESFLRDCYGVSCQVIPNFIDFSMVRADEKSIFPKIKEAIFVGYVRPEKGIRELYELARAFPDITFRLIGEIHNEVMCWQKPDNVMLCGKKNHADILSEMDFADIFVFLSHSEGFSIALLEAMARGLPCIATDVGANKEMLENQGGVIISVGDTVSAVSGLESIQSLCKRREMSAWNLQKVKTFYTAESAISKIKELYEGKVPFQKARGE